MSVWRCRARTQIKAPGRDDAVDIHTCRQCGGRLRIIASIEAPAVIEKILRRLGRAGVDPAHPSRAPPRPDRLL